VIILAFWCVVFYTIPYKSHAQTPFTQPLLYPLPTKTIYDLATDSQGIIYMGTDKGLFRFNGKNVTQIPAPQARQLDITHLKKDKKGRLWGMNFARQILYLENDTLHNFPIGNQDLNASALVAFEFSENQIWVISNTAVVSYDFDSFKRVFACHYSEHLTQIGFFANNIYISTLQKILIFDEKHNFIQKASPTGFEVSFQTQNGYFHAMQRREIKAPLKRTSLLWDKNTNFKELPDIDLPTNIFVYHQTLTPSNIMWLCTRQGGYRVDIKTGKTTLVFPNKNVTDIIQDYQGNYWISTLNDGLWFCPTLHNVSYTVPPSIPQIELTAISLFEKTYILVQTRVTYISPKKIICLIGK
jgi:ligand-binding sensor domain-containing protein